MIRGGSPRTFDVVNRKWLVARDGSIYNYTYYDTRLHELNGLSIFEFNQSHGGLTRRRVGGMLATEGLAVSGIGRIVGLAL